ncbi:MAG: NAD-glutamate dehydrogenase [Deltaproteobacteria bacterium]|nr:NAD-glutamate dehydrogenase [Deltaproteobacteria bacterium]
MKNPTPAPSKKIKKPAIPPSDTTPPGGEPLFEAYAAAFRSQCPPPLLEEMTGSDLPALAQRFEEFQSRPKLPFTIRFDQGINLLRGEFSTLTSIEILTDDHPFLLESLKAFLESAPFVRIGWIHPVFYTRRDPQGGLTHLKNPLGSPPPGPEWSREAQILVWVSGLSPQAQPPLEADLTALLNELILCVGDYPAMAARLALEGTAFAAWPDGASYRKLFEWFSKNLVLLGYLPYRVEADPQGPRLTPLRQEGLGLFRPGGSMNRLAELEQVVQAHLRANLRPHPFMVMEETGFPALIHKREPVSTVMFSPQTAHGRSHAGVLVALFTNHSNQISSLELPLVSEKIEAVFSRRGVIPGSFLHKELTGFFNDLPRYELFRMAASELDLMAGFFLESGAMPRLNQLFVKGEIPGGFRVLVAMAGKRQIYSRMMGLQKRLEKWLGVEAQTVFRVHRETFSLFNLFFLRPPSPFWPPAETDQLEAIIREESLSREERVVSMWVASSGNRMEEWLAKTLVAGMNPDYLVAHSDVEVMVDLAYLEQMLKSGREQLVLRSKSAGGMVGMTLYAMEKFSLSRVMPILTNLKIQAEEEQCHQVSALGRQMFLHTFSISAADEPGMEPSPRISPEKHTEALKELLLGLLAGRLEDNPLNGLALRADFNGRQINLMMLLRNYLMQVGGIYTKKTINDTLIRRWEAAQALFGLFQARLDPALGAADSPARLEAVTRREAAFSQAVQQIDTLTEDRIFKRMRNLIFSTVRTNFFSTPQEPVLALKFHSPSIDQLPLPHPLYEIYLNGPRLEGVHLRGGAISRGGVRYSDRPDDFRTEILGLMATQMKKNALIVPVGAKGGFVVKTLAPYGGDAKTAGDDQYPAYIRGLLSVTDNLEHGRVVPPPGVVRHDGDDCYLVVAADKGTAHLSDTANAISLKTGFWLGDAFASGGAQGYDHKKVGITAKGGWESVKRHFWELGTHPETTPVSVAAIGDMSGDVFGNLMLLSRRFKLVGAFNHKHIFLDPAPDPEKSFLERERLFQLPRSGWNDYNPALISPGGGVFSRQAKAIPLSPQMADVLGIDASVISGEELIQALLSMRVDLLWNGGIGTYIKSAAQTHEQVGDHANDTVRINADQCRAKVVGEGGNQGITQLARLEIDRQGGRINTDFIDNSGGVDMSDHEVNLKILLEELMRTGVIASPDERNRLLASLEPEVTQRVLLNSRQQALVLSMDELRSRQDPAPFARLVDSLVGMGVLDRRVEPIPAGLFGPQPQDHPLPRPLLAVLLAYSKIALYQRLESSPGLDHPAMASWFSGYFPSGLTNLHPLDGVAHPLAHRIIATRITNHIIHRAGMCFVGETALDSGQNWETVAMAYLFADAITGGERFRQHTQPLSLVIPAAAETRLLMAREEALAGMVRRLVRMFSPQKLEFSNLKSHQGLFEEFVEQVEKRLTEDQRRTVEETVRGWAAEGVDEHTARRTAMWAHCGRFVDCLRMAADGGLSIREALNSAPAL